MSFYGILNLSVWGNIIAVLILTHITIAAVTIYLHRCQAHRGIDLHPAVSHFFRFWLWLTTGMVTKEWTAVHRKHHAKCETLDDPHSPQVLGIKKVLSEGAELYKKESKNKETLERYGQGTPDDWMERNIYTRHSVMGVVSMLLMDLFLFGLPGISIWGVQMLWIPIFAAGVINGIGHYWGYRNYECLDAARNIFPLGLLIGGEELHNNHHAFGSAAKFSSKWWEFDLGWGYIQIMKFFKLAKVKKLPPKLNYLPDKNSIDTDTLKALIINRLHVLSEYSRDVILPVLKTEQKRAGEKFHRAKTLLIRELSLINQFDRKTLAALLRKQPSLRKVYYFRQKLHAIWNQTAASQKELIEALQDWCKRAENSGIAVLEKFAGQLKSYAPSFHQ